MAVDYVKIAQGHNNAAGLIRIPVYPVFDPWVPRIIPGLFRVSLSQTIKEDGYRSANLILNPKVPYSVKAAVLAACGLSDSVLYALGTVRLPGNIDHRVYANYDCTFFYAHEDESERRGSGFYIACLFLAAL